MGLKDKVDSLGRYGFFVVANTPFNIPGITAMIGTGIKGYYNSKGMDVDSYTINHAFEYGVAISGAAGGMMMGIGASAAHVPFREGFFSGATTYAISTGLLCSIGYSVGYGLGKMTE